jgi:hypothetical protein
MMHVNLDIRTKPDSGVNWSLRSSSGVRRSASFADGLRSVVCVEGHLIEHKTCGKGVENERFE